MLGAAYTKGRVDALAHFGVKTAAVPLARPFPIGTPHPTAPPVAPHAAPTIVQHAAPTPAPGYALTPHEEAQAQAMRGMSHTQRQEALGLNEHVPAATPAAAPAAAPQAGPSRLQQFMRPVKRGLGLAALGGAGALAYGLHHQNQQDQDARDLVYAPMQGAY